MLRKEGDYEAKKLKNVSVNVKRILIGKDLEMSKLKVLVLIVCCFGLPVQATLVPLEVSSTVSSSVGEYDALHDGLEWLLSYTVYNPNTELPAAAKEVIIPNGTNNGAYKVDSPDNWTGVLAASSCDFSTEVYMDLILPGASKVFTFYIDDAYASLVEGGALKGTSYLSGPYLSGGNVQVPAMVPEPATLALLCMGGLISLRKRV